MESREQKLARIESRQGQIIKKVIDLYRKVDAAQGRKAE
jgi:hypothetical protein